ncbi:MAG: type II toxin-antitoxin system RelE/ParE family toxin [Acidobacteria bacterium]|nr:type II toxin-antitoxin system RelE/ParE family toxin [Acidobacteriota bacterium]MBI3423172.1 type II toxin-antitoxin system RelE/ParE family toxin [Acidobacteriota bacterium]
MKLKRRYFLSADAGSDFAEQFAYFCEAADWEVADRFFTATLAAFDRICEMPEIGNRRRFNNAMLVNVRMWPIKGFDKYRIFYRPLGNRIEILRILHAARDVDAIFGDED